jgi:hypothetical protein
MKTTLQAAAAGIEIEAVNGLVHLTITRLAPGHPDGLVCICNVLTTDEAARFADAFVATACMAEEQLYHRDVDRAFAAMGLPVPPRDLAVWARDAFEASQAGDVPIPAYFGEVRP